MALGCLLSRTLCSSTPTAPTAPTQHSAGCSPPGLRPVYFKMHLGDPVSLLCPPGPGQLSPECSVLKESPTRHGGLVLLRTRTWEPFISGRIPSCDGRQGLRPGVCVFESARKHQTQKQWCSEHLDRNTAQVLQYSAQPCLCVLCRHCGQDAQGDQNP